MALSPPAGGAKLALPVRRRRSLQGGESLHSVSFNEGDFSLLAGAANPALPVRRRRPLRGGRRLHAVSLNGGVLYLNGIAHAAVRDDAVARRRCFLQLGPQGFDVGVDGAVGAVGVIAPHSSQ